MQLWPWFFLQSRFLKSLTTGENLVLICKTTFEEFKMSFNIPPYEVKKWCSKNFSVLIGKELKRQNDPIWISQKCFQIWTSNFHPLLTENLPCTKNQGHICTIFGFPKKLHIDVAGQIFVLNPSNFVRIRLELFTVTFFSSFVGNRDSQ